MSDLALLSVTEAAGAFAKGEATAEALVQASLARIDAHDAQVNSVVRLDREAALEAAAAADRARKAGAKIVKEPQDVFWGGYHAYFADLDGYYWEIAWNPGFPLDDEGMVRLP